jgi:hypothetical protein
MAAIFYGSGQQIAAKSLPPFAAFCRPVSGRIFSVAIATGMVSNQNLLLRVSVFHAIYFCPERIVFRLVSVMVLIL